MQIKRNTMLLPLLAAACVGSAAGVPEPSGRMLRMPESYQNFFPASAIAQAPAGQEQAISLLKGQLPQKPAKLPRLATVTHADPSRAAENAAIYGYLYYFQGNELQNGMYRIGATGSSYMWTDVYTDWSMTMTSGWLRDGKLCGLNSMQFMGGIYAYGQIELDLLTGELLDFHQLNFDGDNLQNQYLTATYRELDGRVYGYGYDATGQGYGFNSADASDIDTSVMIKPVTSDEVCTAICYNVQDDMFYGVNMQGKFVSIDPKGNQSEIFSLNLSGMRGTVTGIVYSPKDGKYIWNAYFQDGTAAMYAIDAQAKTLTKLYDCPYGEEYIYMVCTDDNSAPEAPARAVLGEVSFTGASLSGTVAYTMPGRTAQGAPLAGQLDWRFYVDGVLTNSGTAAAGSKQIVDTGNVTCGMHTFALSVGKDGKYSVPVTFSRWIGSDYPVAPENIKLTETTLTWDPVSLGAHDGYVDASAIKYLIYLNGAKQGETSATTFDMTLPEGMPFTSYTASVVAVADEKQSEPGLSNYITYGEALEINPKIYFRPEEKEFELFTAIDLDGKTTEDGQVRNWQFSEYMGFPSFMSGADGEDLLIFPPIYFSRTDKAFMFSMEAGLRLHTPTTNTIEVWIGKEPTMEGMTQRIMAPFAPQNMLADVLTEYFAVNEPGVYYIGILTKTDAVGIHISELTVSETDRAADLPQTVENLSATADPTGALKATVTFTMPTKTVNGKDIPADTEVTANVVSRTYVLNHPEQGEVNYTKAIKGKPGSTQTVEIETIQNDNTIGVSCTVGGRTGAENTVALYTGVVKPYIVQNLKAEVSEDNLSAKLTWTPPVSSGDVAGPIGEDFFYTVWYYADGWKQLDMVGWNVLEAEVSLDPGAPQNSYILGVMALNDAGQSDYIAQQQVVIGTPYTLPMEETIPDYENIYWPITILRPSPEYQGTYWRVDDPAEVSPIFANTSKVAYIGYIGEVGVKSASSRLSMPKFSTENVKDVKFTLTYWGGPFEASLSLLVNLYGLETPEAIGDFPTGDGWITNTISIPEKYLGKKWVELLLDSRFPNDNSFAMFSGYSISGVSGIEGVGIDVSGRIFAAPGMLHVAGFVGKPLTVSDLSGRIILQVPALEDMAGFALHPGVYVVKAGTEVRKIIVK